jgi:dTDP-4-amino-4,6-dideoxygalactose transaminase
MLFKILLGNSREGIFLKELTSNTPTFLVASGTAALSLTLKSLSQKSPKRQVILPAYTCPSVVASVIKAGLEPILCDLNPNSFQMNLEQIGSKLSSDILAVIAVHLLGIPENINELKELTQKNGIILIENAAQAFGNKLIPPNTFINNHISSPTCSEYLGTIGDIGILSFGRGKPLSLLGGGAILVNNQKLKKIVQEFYRSLPQSNHSLFITIHYFLNLFFYSIFYYPRLYWIPQNIRWLKLGETIFTLDFELERINPTITKLGNTLMLDFDGIRKKRQELTKIYRETLEPLRDEFGFLPEFEGEDIALLRFPIIFKNKEKRDRILAQLKKKGLGASGMYPVPLNEQDGVPSYLKTIESYPNAKATSEKLLTLPLHGHVKMNDIERIHQIIEQCLAE